jgi:hypothetical protein
MVKIFRMARSGAVLLAVCLASAGANATCQPPASWSPTAPYSMGAVVAYDIVSGSTLVSGAFYQAQVNIAAGNLPPPSNPQWTSNNVLVCKLKVQPIDMCSSTGTGCAVINSMGQTAVTNPGTNLIGFIDPLTGVNAEQRAMAAIGVSLAFNPVVQFNSPANSCTTSKLTEPDYRWLHVVNCGAANPLFTPSGGKCGPATIPACTTGSTSPDLNTITQQDGISQGATPQNPLNADPTVPNLFFVKVIHPAASGIIIKGFSQEMNNGGAIAADSVFTSPFSPGTVVHELGHQAGWEHNVFGAGPLTCTSTFPLCPDNLMTAGSAPRQLPNGLTNCGTSGTQACWVTQIAPNNTTPPILDQLTTGGVGSCTPANFSSCPSQQAAALLSNFMYTISNTSTGVSQSGTGTASTLAATQNTASGQANTSSGDPIVFNVSTLTSSPGETLLAWILTLPQGFTFDSHNQFKILSESRRNLLQDVDYSPPALDSDVPYPPCASVLCIEVEFNRNKGQGFTQGDFMNFSQGILDNSSQPVSLGELCGAKVTLIYSDGYAPTSTLGNCGSSSLTASSLSQDPTTPPQIVSVSTSVVSTNPPCTPTNHGKCTPPSMLGVSDSNLTTGAETAICFDLNGIPYTCP